jgi:hypothetical protein
LLGSPAGSAAAKHTIARTSEQKAIKLAVKAGRKATQAMQREGRHSRAGWQHGKSDYSSCETE